jgi:hypothetical protein
MFELRYSSCTVGAVKIYVGAAEALRKKERQDVTQFTTKICGKLSLDPLLCRFVKFSFSFQVTRLMPYDAETGHSCPLINHETLPITLLSKKNFGGSLRIKASHYSNLHKQGRF